MLGIEKMFNSVEKVDKAAQQNDNNNLDTVLKAISDLTLLVTNLQELIKPTEQLETETETETETKQKEQPETEHEQEKEK